MDHSKCKPFNETNAYSFGVAVPQKYDGNSALPINYWGHGMGGGYRVRATAPYIHALWIWLGDESGSWFFGVMNKVAEGTVKPDEHGLLTVVKFNVVHTGLGSRLVIRRAMEVAAKPGR
jgi:hypothetical protein